MKTTTKNFATQQLSKKQMNQVRGGERDPYQAWECHWDGGMTIIAEKDFPQLVTEMEGTGLEVRCKMV